MRVKWMALSLVAVLAVALATGDAIGKGGGFGGGSSSSGRSGGSSFSGGSSSRSGGSSFSGGSSSRSSGSSFGGSSSKPSSSFGGGSSSKPSGSSWSGSSSSKPSSGSTFSGSSKPSSGSSWFGGSSKPTTPTPVTTSKSTYTGGSDTTIKSASSFDSGAAKAQSKEASKAAYKQAHPDPVKSPVVTKTETKTVDGKPKQVTTQTRVVTHERYVTYDNRAGGYYGRYSSYPMVHYHDSYNPFFTLWMIDNLTARDRAMWIYNHPDADQARVDKLVQDNAEVKAELAALKAKGATPDPTFVPPALASDPDMMYAKDYVQPVSTTAPSLVPAPSQYHPFRWLVGICIIAGVAFALIAILGKS